MRNPGLILSAFGSLLSKSGARFRFYIKTGDNKPQNSGSYSREENTVAKAFKRRITQVYPATSVFMGKTHSL